MTDTAKHTQGWQPMDTAPKDGKDLILGNARMSTLGFWDDPKADELGSGDDFNIPRLIDEPSWVGYRSFPPDEPPTHWRPFLPVPATTFNPSTPDLAAQNAALREEIGKLRSFASEVIDCIWSTRADAISNKIESIAINYGLLEVVDGRPGEDELIVLKSAALAAVKGDA